MKIKRSLKSHIKYAKLRYPSLYTRGMDEKLSRMRVLEHILATNGTGFEFQSDGSIANSFDDTTKNWEKKKKKQWEYEKEEWQGSYDKSVIRAKSSAKSDYHRVEILLSMAKKSYEDDKWYYDTFDPYADIHRDLGTSPYIVKEKVVDVYPLSKGFSPIYELPDNCKKDIVLGSIELLDYMIETEQQLDKVVPLRTEIRERFLLKEIREEKINEILN